MFDVRDVVEYVPNLGVPNSLFLNAHHVDGKNAPNLLMQENFEFVEQAVLK